MAYLAALGWGVLSGILSPCMWAMFPIVLTYVAHETADENTPKTEGFVLSSAFVLGMAAVFGVLGAAISLVGGFFRTQQYLISLIAGLILIGVGLSFLGVYRLPIPGFMNSGLGPAKRKGIVGAVVLGVVGAIVMGPCGISYLTPILAVALREGRFAFGGTLAFVFGIGHGVPLIFLGTLAGVATAWLKKMQSAKKYIDIVSGAALIVAGLYYLWRV
jgi:cytochrome c-type biogenesis protein